MMFHPVCHVTEVCTTTGSTICIFSGLLFGLHLALKTEPVLGDWMDHYI